MENNLIKTNYNNEEVVFKVENGVSYYHCSNCDCDAEFSLRTDNEEE